MSLDRASGAVRMQAVCARIFPARPRSLAAVAVGAFFAAAALSACEGEEAPGDEDDAAEEREPSPGKKDGGSKSGQDASADSSRAAGARDSGRPGDAGTKADGAPGSDNGSAPSGSHDSGQGHSNSVHDDCVDGQLADSRDSQLTGQPDQWRASSGAIDLVLPEAVLDWMDERAWKQSHDAWHNVRRCGLAGGFSGFAGLGGAATDICSHSELIPADQECENASDGYQFLVMHRHMIHALKQAFPEHQELFEGFPEFPYEAADVPEQWRGRWGTGWSQATLNVANTLEDVENRLSQFPSEGDLGMYIQCGGGFGGGSSMHGALHFKWVVNESPNSLGKQAVNIGNYMFWKLHGWIDKIWERYRVAKGLTAEEPTLQEALEGQCREMHALGKVIDPSIGGGASEPLPDESGVFHDQVRPILEKYCSGCHSESSPEAMLTLGGQVSSADVVEGLVNVQAVRGGQFRRVVPGEPEQSWLYLKLSGMAEDAGCEGRCNAQIMPPGSMIEADELATIRQWILDGAEAPTTP